jgi:hypothetical protein
LLTLERMDLPSDWLAIYHVAGKYRSFCDDRSAEARVISPRCG